MRGSAPPAQPDASTEKRRYVRELFSDIAPRYDFLNRVLSLNVDRSWRRRALGRLAWQSRPDGAYLDACAGTLDLAMLLAGQHGFRGRVTATDFALPMLRIGSRKAGSVVRSTAADTLVLPFSNETFDGATVGFGIRNLVDLEAGLAELWRVLRPGARVVVLDFTTPRFAPLRAVYLWYLQRVLPVVGKAVSGHPTAYSYLPESVRKFSTPEELEGHLEAVGFRDCGHELLTGGIAAVTWGIR